MVKIVKTVEELEKLFIGLGSGRYYNPERQLYNLIRKNSSPYNRLRYIRALVRNLQRKNVIVSIEVIKDLYVK